MNKVFTAGIISNGQIKMFYSMPVRRVCTNALTSFLEEPLVTKAIHGSKIEVHRPNVSLDQYLSRSR